MSLSINSLLSEFVNYIPLNFFCRPVVDSISFFVIISERIFSFVSNKVLLFFPNRFFSKCLKPALLFDFFSSSNYGRLLSVVGCISLDFLLSIVMDDFDFLLSLITYNDCSDSEGSSPKYSFIGTSAYLYSGFYFNNSYFMFFLLANYYIFIFI